MYCSKVIKIFYVHFSHIQQTQKIAFTPIRNEFGAWKSNADMGNAKTARNQYLRQTRDDKTSFPSDGKTSYANYNLPLCETRKIEQHCGTNEGSSWYDTAVGRFGAIFPQEKSRGKRAANPAGQELARYNDLGSLCSRGPLLGRREESRGRKSLSTLNENTDKIDPRRRPLSLWYGCSHETHPTYISVSIALKLRNSRSRGCCASRSSSLKMFE